MKEQVDRAWGSGIGTFLGTSRREVSGTNAQTRCGYLVPSTCLIACGQPCMLLALNPLPDIQGVLGLEVRDNISGDFGVCWVFGAFFLRKGYRGARFLEVQGLEFGEKFRVFLVWALNPKA